MIYVSLFRGCEHSRGIIRAFVFNCTRAAVGAHGDLTEQLAGPISAWIAAARAAGDARRVLSRVRRDFSGTKATAARIARSTYNPVRKRESAAALVGTNRRRCRVYVQKRGVFRGRLRSIRDVNYL